MKKNEPVTHIMTKDVLTVHVGQKLSDVRRILEEKGIHHLPVVDGKKLIGILSATDMMRLSFGAYGASDPRSLDAIMDHQFTISDAMKREVTTVDNHASIRDAANALKGGAFHAVPVVNGDRELLGIVTSTDLIQYLLDQY